MSIDAKFRCQSEWFSEAFSKGPSTPPHSPPPHTPANPSPVAVRGGKLEESAKSAERFLQPWISEQNIKQQRLSMTSSRGIKCTLHHCGASLLWTLLCSRKKTSGKKKRGKRPFGGEVKTNSLCNLRSYDADCLHYVMVPLRDCSWDVEAFNTSNDRSSFLKPSVVRKKQNCRRMKVILCWWWLSQQLQRKTNEKKQQWEAFFLAFGTKRTRNTRRS